MSSNDKKYSTLHIIAGLCAIPFGWALYKIDDGYFNKWVMNGVVCLLVLYMVFIVASIIKHKISVGRAISTIIGQFSNSIIAGIFIYYLAEFMGDHEIYDVFGHPTGRTESGLDAVLSDSFAHIVYVPLLLICATYSIIYWRTTHKKKSEAKEDTQVNK